MKAQITQGESSINTQLKVASYNVHQWIGRDRRHNPRRVMGVLNELDADVMGLQEVILHSEDCDGVRAQALASATGKEVISGPTFQCGNGRFGNVLLTSLRVLRSEKIDLSVKSREPRCALDVTVEFHNLPIRIIVTHLGLRPLERKRQVARLLESVVDCPDRCCIMMGDFNLWSPASPALNKFTVHFGHSPARRTFPSRLPLLPLDRIWVYPKGAIRDLRVHRTAAARVASDHLPIKAAIDLGTGADG